MNIPRCPVCGMTMTKHGTTASGRRRWRCRACQLTQTNQIDNTAKRLDAFLAFLFSQQHYKDLPGQGRTFRRRCQDLWQIWPMPPVVDYNHDVIHLDGIHLGRKAVVLIACTHTQVLGWYTARSENCRAWSALISNISPPGRGDH